MHPHPSHVSVEHGVTRLDDRPAEPWHDGCSICWPAMAAAFAQAVEEGWGDHFPASDGDDLTTCVICGGTINPDGSETPWTPAPTDGAPSG